MAALALVGYAILALLALASLLALAVLVVKLVSPWSFLKLKTPPGFILHAMTGGHVPPYFGVWPFEDRYFRRVFRDGDVCVCSMAKGGTTWLLNIVHQIRTLGDPRGSLEHHTLTTPWPECWRYPGQTPEELLAQMSAEDGFTNPEYPFRVFKSHYKPLPAGVRWEVGAKTEEIVPVRAHPGVKYVVCFREGHDVVESFFPFFSKHCQGFKDMWGQFPPNFKDFQACFNFFARDMPGFYHGFASMWWPYRHDPNVLVLHYKDLRTDTLGQLKRIARFVGVDVPPESWPLIERKVSIEWMKENEDKFKYFVPGAPFKYVMNDEAGSMIRQGKTGEGAKRFTPQMEAEWEKLNEKYFSDRPGLGEWIMSGGSLPQLSAAELQQQRREEAAAAEPKGAGGGLAAPLLA